MCIIISIILRQIMIITIRITIHTKATIRTKATVPIMTMKSSRISREIITRKNPKVTTNRRATKNSWECAGNTMTTSIIIKYNISEIGQIARLITFTRPVSLEVWRSKSNAI